MSRLIKERGEHEALKLDKTYKATLDCVTPYIHALKIPEDGHLCRKWLQKLSRASSQRSLRNRYLLELCCHLKSGRIGGVFCKPPQSGPLEPLPKFCDRTINTSSSMSELSDTTSVPQEIASRPMTRSRTKSFSGNRSSDSSSTNCDYEIAPATRYCEKLRSEGHQTSTYKRRIESLTALVRDLRAQKECLQRSLSYSRENCDCGEKTNNLGSTIEQLTLEITALRARLVEMNAMKNALEKNHCEIVGQYKSAMTREFNDLNARLEEARSRNDELNARVTTISAQLDKIIHEKNEESAVLEKNFNEAIEAARVQCADELAERDYELSRRDQIISEKDAELATRERHHRDEIASLNDRIRALEDKLETKIEDEGKLQSFLKEQCSTMKEEFAKLRNDMEVSARTENQCLVEKISALKKIILRLVKSKEKQSVDYENRISRVLKTKDLEIKNLELQLQEQQNALTASLNSDKQCELDGLVRLLEDRYKAILAATDASVGNQRQSFLKKITFLENQVTSMKNNLVGSDLYV